jgi:hypothetical protein
MYHKGMHRQSHHPGQVVGVEACFPVPEGFYLKPWPDRIGPERNSGCPGTVSSTCCRVAPIAMIFIPCKNGWSHRPDEFASAKDIANGVHVLALTMAQLSDGIWGSSGAGVSQHNEL